MPGYKRRYRRKYKKKTYRKRNFTPYKRKTRKRTMLKIPKQVVSNLAEKTIVTLKFTWCGRLAPDAPPVNRAWHTFRANSIWDPDEFALPLGQKACQGHTEFSNFYSDYRVIGAIINVKYLNDQVDPAFVGITSSNQAENIDLEAAIQIMKERTTYRLLGPSISGNNSGKLKIGYSPKSVLNREQQVNQDTGVTSNPNTSWYFTVWALNSNGIIDPFSVYPFVCVTIKYRVLYSKRKNLAFSAGPLI